MVRPPQKCHQHWNKEAKRTAECLKYSASLEGRRPGNGCFGGKAEPGVLADGTSQSTLDTALGCRRVRGDGRALKPHEDLLLPSSPQLLPEQLQGFPGLLVFHPALQGSSSGRATTGAGQGELRGASPAALHPIWPPDGCNCIPPGCTATYSLCSASSSLPGISSGQADPSSCPTRDQHSLSTVAPSLGLE